MERPWMDTDLAVEERVEALLAIMTLPEMVGQLHQPANVDAVADREALVSGSIGTSLFASGATAGNVRDDGLAATAMEQCRELSTSSRLAVPILFARDVIHGHRSVYPIPLGMAATWDEGLAEECAALAAAEASADGVGWTFAPMLDIGEDPRWGRVAESLGESPVLAGRIGAAMVRGFQRDSFAATAKHYVGYGASRGGRDYASVGLGENTLRNVHLRPFKAAIDAGCATVMAAFSDVDGIPMHSHRHLLRDVLKGEWGFRGVVVADWNGIGELVEHGVAADLRDAARQAIEAGVDVDMVSGAYTTHLVDLVESGEVDRALVQDAARRVLRLKIGLGMLDRPAPDTAARTPAGPTRPGAGERELMRRAASASMVVVKNDGVLPLAGEGTLHVGGPFLDEGTALLGTWTLDGEGDDVATIHAAFEERWGERLRTTDGRFSDLTTAVSRGSDATVMLLGEHPCRSGENASVTDIGLPAGQVEVLRQVAALGRPVVAVVFTGRALDLEEVLAHADAVVIAWHPGIEAGPALVDVLDGTTAPTGRLPVTFPRRGSTPYSSLERPSGRPLVPGVQEVHGAYVETVTGPLVPFGSGLGYTTFDLGRVTGSAEVLDSRDPITVEAEVTNTGERAGRELVLLEVRDLVAEVTRPIRELADFRSVDLAPGETGTVRFEVDREAFGYFGRDNTWRVDPGRVEVVVRTGGQGSATLALTIE